MERESFVKALTCMTREEISNYIKTKGKEPKMINPFVVFPYESSMKSKTIKKEEKKCRH